MNYSCSRNRAVHEKSLLIGGGFDRSVDNAGVGQSDVFGDFAIDGKRFETLAEFGEGDADGDKVDTRFGLLDEFDKVVAVAVHRNEFAAALAGFEFEGFGGATTIDVFTVDDAAGFLVDDFAAERLGYGLVIVTVVGEHRLNLLGGSCGVSVDFLFDGRLDEAEVEHALVFGFVEAEIIGDNFHESFFAAIDAADFQVAIEFFGDVFFGDSDVLLPRELDGIGVGLCVSKGGAVVFVAKIFDGGLVELAAGLALDGGHTAAIKQNIV